MSTGPILEMKSRKDILPPTSPSSMGPPRMSDPSLPVRKRLSPKPHRSRTKSDLHAWSGSMQEKNYPGTLNVFRHLVKSGSAPVWKAFGVVHQGWMWKRGGKFETWKKRWFVLRGDIIFYFREQEDLKHVGEIPLAGNEVRRIESNDIRGAPTKFLFEIIPGEGSEGFVKGRPNFLIGAFNELDMEEWLTKISHVISSEQKCMFKQSISATVSRECVLPYGGTVPLVVVHTCCFLQQYGLKELGLFRQSGRMQRTKELQEQFDKGKYPAFGSRLDTDVHTVASLLKLYLRSIPDAVIPQEYNESFIAATKFYQQSGPSEGVQVLKGQLKGLPEANYNCLKYVCRFLHNVQKCSDSNRMDITNLATVFGPNFVRSQHDEALIPDVTAMMMVAKSTGDMNVLTRILISEHEKLFPVVEGESPVFGLQDYDSLNVGELANSCDSSGSNGSVSTSSHERCSRQHTAPGALSSSGGSSSAAMNPFMSVDQAANLSRGDLVSFDSSDDEDEVDCIKSNGTSLPTDIDKLLGELDPIADRQPVATPRPPAVMPRTGRSAADGRNAQVTDRLKEMHDEVAQHSEMARIAVTQLQDEVLARKAWERRYQEERKAREAAEDRAKVLERQLDELFRQHF